MGVLYFDYKLIARLRRKKDFNTIKDVLMLTINVLRYKNGNVSYGYHCNQRKMVTEDWIEERRFRKAHRFGKYFIKQFPKLAEYVKDEAG